MSSNNQSSPSSRVCLRRLRTQLALRVALLLGLFVGVMGCVNQCDVPFPPSSFVDKMRILAVQADPPEVTPGESVSLRFLAVDEKGVIPHKTFLTFPACFSEQGPVDPSAFWVGCLPGVGPVEDSSRSCTNFDFLQTPGGGDGGPQQDGGATDGGGGFDPSKFQLVSPPCGEVVRWPTPKAYLDPLPEDEQKTGREAVIVLSTLLNKEQQVTFKRVRLSKREPALQNTNPHFIGMIAGSRELKCCTEEDPDACEVLEVPLGGSVRLEARLDLTRQDKLAVEIPDQPKEDISIVWFTNAGELNRQSTLLSGRKQQQSRRTWPRWFPTDFRGNALKVGDESTVVAIAQDFRGGIDWLICRLRVGPPKVQEGVPDSQ